MQNQQLLEFENFFQRGFANDLHWAQIHYFIYRTIGENYNEISNKENDLEKNRIGYIQYVSHEMAMLHLSKIFDRQHKKFKVRCLENVISDCENIESNYFPLNLDNYPYITQMSTISETIITKVSKKDRKGFISYLKEVINSTKSRSAINNLHLVRDKFLVHNEHNTGITGISTFWDDFAYLMNLAKLYLIIIGEIFLETSYSMDTEIDTNKIDSYVYNDAYWIVETLEGYLGNKFIRWYKI